MRSGVVIAILLLAACSSDDSSSEPDGTCKTICDCVCAGASDSSCFSQCNAECADHSAACRKCYLDVGCDKLKGVMDHPQACDVTCN